MRTEKAVGPKRKDIWRCLSQWKIPPDREVALNGLDFHNLPVIGQRLRQDEPIPQGLFLKLAEKLNPSDSKKGRYVLRRAIGRPRKSSPSLDPIVSAMNRGELAQIAAHLRDAPAPDPRLLRWMADRLDPAGPSDPHFIIKLPPGRPWGKSPWKEMSDMMVAHRVNADLQVHGKLEAALHSVVEKLGISRSTARRKMKKYS
jgi:hypothetical protein